LDDKKARIDRSREAWNAIQPDFADIEQKMLNEILPDGLRRGEKRRPPHVRSKEIIVCDQPLGWNMVHFDVQLVGGVALHRGMIAEMATGEGKDARRHPAGVFERAHRTRRARHHGE
jgi:preprotein translocase subunit SecA